MRKCLLFVLLMCSLPIRAQLSQNLIAPNRAIDWTGAGAGTSLSSTYTQSGATLASNVSCTTIQSALNACSNGQYVQLGSGVFNLSCGLSIKNNGCVLRGMGADPTKGGTELVLSGSVSVNDGTAGIAIWGNDSTFWVPGTTCLWTGGYAKGATQITITASPSCASALSPGMIIAMNQDDIGYSGNPATGSAIDNGNFFPCDDIYASTTVGCSNEGADSGNGTPHRFQTELHTVTAVNPSTGVITIAEPLENPNWSSSQTPMVWFFTPITGSGVENLWLAMDGNTSAKYGVGIFNGTKDWVTGVKVTNPVTSPVALFDTQNTTILSNYFWEAQSSDPFGPHLTVTDRILVCNNIVQQITVGMMTEGSDTGSVFCYNIAPASCNYLSPTNACKSDDVSQGGRSHSDGNNMELWEGNIFTTIDLDGTHGAHLGDTIFGNLLPGWESCATSPYCGTDTAKDFLTNSLLFYSKQSRYFNAINNVLGEPGYHTDYTYTTGQDNHAIIGLGIPVSGNIPPTDPVVQSTGMLFGNYDVANGTVRRVSSEVPTSIPVFPNPLPTICTDASPTTCPASLVFKTRPAWYSATIPFPLIGPEVTGGNVGICSGPFNIAGQYDGVIALNNAQCGNHGFTASAWAGHANASPALLCYLNIMQGTPDGTGPALPFDANTCYGATGTPNFVTPTENLTTIDSLLKNDVLHLTFTSSTTTVDSAAQVHPTSHSGSATTTISESDSVSRLPAKVSTEVLITADSVTMQRIQAAQRGETETLSESDASFASKVSSVNRACAETLAVVDAMNAHPNFLGHALKTVCSVNNQTSTRILSENLSILDSVATQ